MAIQFIAEHHEYSSIDSDDIKWTSVTSFISKFKKPFDAEGIALKVSKSKNSKWFGMKPEDIKKAWTLEAKRATDLGTWYHNQREADLCGLSTIGRNGVDIPVIKPIMEGGVKIAPDQRLTEGIYPEHMIYLKSAGLCGQSDLVEIINGKVNIIDYKTNKEIKQESFKNWDGVKQKMLPPISHLDDCNFNHYALQLSMYMYIILKHNYIYKPGEMTLHHIIFEEVDKDRWGNPITAIDSDGNPIVKDIVKYNIPYLKSEIVSLINHLKNEQNKN